MPRIIGTFNGTNICVVPAPGVGKKIVVRSLVVGTEDANTDWQFFSKGDVVTSIAPSMDYLSNAGAVLPPDNDEGWFECLENQELAISSNAPVDLLGTYRIFPA